MQMQLSEAHQVRGEVGQGAAAAARDAAEEDRRQPQEQEGEAREGQLLFEGVEGGAAGLDTCTVC